MKQVLIAYGAMLLLITSLIIRAFLSPIPNSKLNKIHEGMTKPEVEAIIGKPSFITESGSQWIYQRSLVIGYVSITWLEDGTYDGQYNLERF
ncbi:MAG TPA: outer membrane protein assembly factor BamE [Saprospiraceae bacterium]|nr:outer membrane protein assembly factor BamE [Saprospiraceae bacterium]